MAQTHGFAAAFAMLAGALMLGAATWSHFECKQRDDDGAQQAVHLLSFFAASSL